MSKITNIKIENVKGFGTTDNSFEKEIISNKINILVAPNGFGKSSITAAFNSLEYKKIKLEKKDFHRGNESLSPVLSITEEDITYTANSVKNEISSKFKVFCIKNLINAKAVGKNLGSFFSTSGHLSIDDIEIVKKIPEKKTIPYKITQIKKDFGCNSKILTDINEELFSNSKFLCNAEQLYQDLEKFSAKKRKKEIELIIENINSASGSATDIKNNFDTNILSSLERESPYNTITNYINKITPLSTKLDTFLYFYQLQFLFLNNKKAFKSTVTRAKYDSFKENFNNNLKLIGSTWKDIKATEKNNSLIVSFPHATDISYGQRDVLTLYIKLQEIKSKIRPGDKSIIIIDEVFDYLDALNMTITQYYLSEILNELKKTSCIYPIIMTHFDPEYFRSYIFSPKKLNIIDLKKAEALPAHSIKKLLLNRDEDSIKDDVSKYLFHYSPGTINKRNEFKTLELKESWGESTIFLQYIVDETNKYLNNNTDFEPYAVCIALRIRIEKLIYDKLATDSEKELFILEHKTKEKLIFAENNLQEIPDLYYLLGIIYNDAAHIKEGNRDKPSIYRLNHIIIKEMIQKIFSYENQPIDLSYIH